MSKVTLKTLATALNLDISSVSKALNNKEDIGEETRERVKKMALELGYSPNLLAKGLSQKRTNMIGVMIPDLSLSFYIKVLRGIFEEAEKHKFMPILLINDENPVLEKKNMEFFASLRVDGILINPSPDGHNAELIRSMQKQGINLVSYDRVVQDFDISAVTNDNVKASYELTQKLIAQGRKRILYLGPTSKISVAEDRFLGYQKALSDNNILIHAEYIQNCQLNEFDSYSVVKNMLDKDQIPDGVICMGGLVALGAGKAIIEKGLKIPDQVVLAEFGDNDIVSKLGVPFFSVDQSPFEIGKSAVELLVSEINEIEIKPQKVIIPYIIKSYEL
jgi:DNA-binding LacI/PurR family transcriptional regulator